jgi:hypothetical protein
MSERQFGAGLFAMQMIIAGATYWSGATITAHLIAGAVAAFGYIACGRRR